MKSKLHNPLVMLAMLALAIFNSELSTAVAQGTAFSYEGQLIDTGSPANGFYDLQFILYNASIGGSEVGPILTNAATPVSNGLFNVTLNFGSSIFTGSDYWLDLAARTNGSSKFVALSPRQELAPTPYAIFAEGANAAGLNGTIPMASLSGAYGYEFNLTNAANSFAGNGAGLTGVNAASLDGVKATNFWAATGNAGTSPTSGNFVGTTDNNPLELRVNSKRALRLEPTTNDANHSGIVNVVNGSTVNFAGAAVYGATISGGGASNYFGSPGPNSVTADFASVAGGIGNSASGVSAFVGGGGYEGSVVSGNTASGTASVIGGGIANSANFFTATVGGGYANIASGNAFGAATVSGGLNNIAGTDFATISGGTANSASGVGSYVGGGGSDGTTGGPFHLIQTWGNDASGGVSVIAGGLGNTNLSYGGTIAGGTFNSADGTNATVGGGSFNDAKGTSYGYATVSGGFSNISAGYATVAGGINNSALGFGSFIGGGGYDGFTGGGNTATGDGSVVGGGVSNSADNRASTVGGGAFNTADSGYATVGGGTGNTASGRGSFVGGGGYDGTFAGNEAAGFASVVGGGYGNTSGGNYSTVAGGAYDNASSNYATVCGGFDNGASGEYAAVPGGYFNNASGSYSTVSGGGGNGASGEYATVPGGSGNSAQGQYSFAGGKGATARYNGTFVWSDSTGTPTKDTGKNQFVVRANGGFWFYTGTDSTTGAHLSTGDSSWTTLSDRNAKKDIEPEDCRTVLDKLARVPIAHWHYKWEAETNTPHIGPMAQDFKHAFYPGRDDKGITTLEFDGVELAAIQGLNQKVDEKEARIQDQAAEIKNLKQQNDLLAARLNELEATVRQLVAR